MELSIYFLAFSLSLKICSCIRCYKCEEEANDGKLLCKDFDGSDKFVTNCEHSTMCYKRNTTSPFANQMVSNVRRGCAPQTIDGDQKKINGKWQKVNTTYEVYDEGCKEETSDYDRIPKIINCYCRGHLCNNSSKNRFNLTTNITILLFTIVYLIS